MAIDESGADFLAAAGAGGVHHHGGSLLDHLVGTNRLLELWGCAPRVCSAGVFHSFYSWLAEPTDRSRMALAAAIGPDAEELVHLFGSTVPDDLVEPNASAREGQVLLKTASGSVPVGRHTYADLLWLDLANTQDILGRASLDAGQRRRLEARCAHVRESLASLGAVEPRECEGARA
jgi:hypothetical protein